jgi:hypothetical protein
MDMRQLIAQIDHIENKQILNENAHYATAPVVNSPRVSKSNNQTSIYEMLIKEFGYDLNEIGPIQGAPGTAPAAAAPAAGGVANPYQGADAAKFAAMSPADQAWLTKGGGKPDINDEFILARAPNGGKPTAPAAAPASALPAGMTQADVDAAQNRSEPDPRLPAGMTQADVDAAQNRSEPEAAGQPVNNTTSGYAGATPAPGSAAQPAAPAAPSAATPQAQQDAQNRSEPTAAGSKEQMASIMNMQRELGVTADGKIGPKTRDAMARKPEIAAKYAGELGGAKQFPGAKPGGSAAQPATKPGAPNQSDAETARLARQNAAKPAATGSAAQPAPTGKPPRYKTPAEFDKEIARFSKSSDPNLPPNARYIATLQAEKAALSGGAPQPAAPAAPTTSGGRPYTPPAGAGTPSEQKLEKKLAASGAPVQQGAVSKEFENSAKSQDDAILERIRKALYR